MREDLLKREEDIIQEITIWSIMILPIDPTIIIIIIINLPPITILQDIMNREENIIIMSIHPIIGSRIIIIIIIRIIPSMIGIEDLTLLNLITNPNIILRHIIMNIFTM